MKKPPIQSFACNDERGTEVGVTAHHLPDGHIQMATDSGDDAISCIAPPDARALAHWLLEAADASEAPA